MFHQKNRSKTNKDEEANSDVDNDQMVLQLNAFLNLSEAET